MERKTYLSYATLHEIFPALSEAELKRQLRQSCDYIRAGPNHGCYVLKSHLRAPEDVVGDDDDFEEVFAKPK